MRKFGVLGCIVLLFCLVVAGGCSKKVSSAPAGATAAGSSSGSQGGLTAEQLEAQRLAELQRQAIEKISVDKIYFAFDSNAEQLFSNFTIMHNRLNTTIKNILIFIFPPFCTITFYFDLLESRKFFQKKT